MNYSDQLFQFAIVLQYTIEVFFFLRQTIMLFIIDPLLSHVTSSAINLFNILTWLIVLLKQAHLIKVLGLVRIPWLRGTSFYTIH